jgi:hypothetical protein
MVADAGSTSGAASMPQSSRVSAVDFRGRPEAKMPSTVDVWLGLIGKLLDDSAMRAVQKEFDLSPKGPRLSGGTGTENVSKAGVVIFFRAVEPGGKQVTDLQFRAKGFEGHEPYAGELRKGLVWTDSCASVTAKIGRALFTSPMVENQRWEFGDRCMTVDFTADWGAIKKVQFGMSSPEFAATVAAMKQGTPPVSVLRAVA